MKVKYVAEDRWQGFQRGASYEAVKNFMADGTWFVYKEGGNVHLDGGGIGYYVKDHQYAFEIEED